MMLYRHSSASSYIGYPSRLPPNTRMQHDRFARKIVGILALSYAARSRRLMRKPLGGNHSHTLFSSSPFFSIDRRVSKMLT